MDRGGEEAASTAYHDFIGGEIDYHEMALANKRRLLARNLAAELEALKDIARRLAEQDRTTRDLGPDTLRRAMLEVIAALPVYRTYVDVTGASPADRELIAAAVEAARSTREVEDESALDFLQRVLLLDFSEPEHQAAALEFAARFQQTTGPVMAKAIEDTLFYQYNRLIGLNEVGGEAHEFGALPERFHADMQRRLSAQPLGLSTTATHDTKRGEDARARLYVLSEMPEVWAASVKRWRDLNRPLTQERAGGHLPDPETEWAFYQALLGAWPLDLAVEDEQGLDMLGSRMVQFMLKAVREAKVRTSWTDQDTDYEDAIEEFTHAALDPQRSRIFLQEFLEVCRPIFAAGALNSLSQTLIKLAVPGVPDIYQGTELRDFSLVDPDNRSPVDFEARRDGLDRLTQSDPASIVEN